MVDFDDMDECPICKARREAERRWRNEGRAILAGLLIGLAISVGVIVAEMIAG